MMLPPKENVIFGDNLNSLWFRPLALTFFALLLFLLCTILPFLLFHFTSVLVFKLSLFTEIYSVVILLLHKVTLKHVGSSGHE